MKITSPNFEPMGKIPVKFTGDGQDINPNLKISKTPENTKSLVLIMEDPDAPVGIFTHWLVWDISPNLTGIKENSVPKNAIQGRNDFGKIGYGGPMPPSGSHRYFFKIFALDVKLNLQEGANKEELERAIQGHIIDKVELIGLYR